MSTTVWRWYSRLRLHVRMSYNFSHCRFIQQRGDRGCWVTFPARTQHWPPTDKLKLGIRLVRDAVHQSFGACKENPISPTSKNENFDIRSFNSYFVIMEDIVQSIVEAILAFQLLGDVSALPCRFLSCGGLHTWHV
jgi:hypothetical protein